MFFHAAPNDRSDIISNFSNVMLSDLINVDNLLINCERLIWIFTALLRCSSITTVCQRRSPTPCSSHCRSSILHFLRNTNGPYIILLLQRRRSSNRSCICHCRVIFVVLSSRLLYTHCHRHRTSYIALVSIVLIPFARTIVDS